MYSNDFNTICTSTLAHSFKIMAHNYKKKYMQFNQTSAFRGTSEHTKVDKLETGNILNFFSPDEQKLIITNINEIVKGKLFFLTVLHVSFMSSTGNSVQKRRSLPLPI